MKRGGPIERRTPLRAKTGLARKRERPERKVSPPKPRAAKRKGLRRPAMDGNLRAAVYERAAGMCDRCGHAIHPDAWECHHRKLRSQGGEDSHENLIALCPGCHAWAHGNPLAAKTQGFIVPPWDDPAETPVLRHGRAFWLPVGQTWCLANK